MQRLRWGQTLSWGTDMASIHYAGDGWRHLIPRGAEPTREVLRAVFTKYRKRLADAGHKDYAADPVESREERKAYVNHGRWLIDCPVCNNSPLVSDRSPEAEACCVECGTIWTNITFPDEAEEIEKVLVARTRRMNQNWELHETIEDLKKENADHTEVIR